MRIRHTVLVLLAAASVLQAAAGAAMAQFSQRPAPERAAIPKSLAPEAMNALVQKLDVEQTEALGRLMELLGKSADAAALKAAVARPSAMEVLSASFEVFKASVMSHALALPDVLQGVWVSLASLFEGRGASATLLFLGAAALAILVGAARRSAARGRRRCARPCAR